MQTSISVAMTTCNGQKYIEQQIESLLAQTLPPAEIIICDDNSTDDTRKILGRYEASGRIKAFYNNEQLGVIRNFKKAVQHCDDNNYVAFCDQDDYWLPEKLQKEKDALDSFALPNVPSMVYSDLSLVDESLNVLSPSFWRVLNVDPAKEKLQSLLFGNFITGCTILMNQEMKKIFSHIPEEGVMMHDAWLALIAFTFGRCKFIDELLVLYRQHGNNVTYETTNQNSLLKKISAAGKYLQNGNGFLASEMQMAKTFLAAYNEKLTADQKNTFKNFIDLENTSFLKKKIYRVISRIYRLSNLY